LNRITNVVECQSMNDEQYRQLPGVDKVIAEPEVKKYISLFKQEVVIDVARRNIDEARRHIAKGLTVPSYKEIVSNVITHLDLLDNPSLNPVINATGVIIHTNLGRAPLSRETLLAMEIASKGFNNLEFSLESGARGSRYVHIETILCQLSGAESGIAVNNNAGAVLLVLTALAKRKEVIVSRGEAVEIGGGFRIPDVMRQSGSKLVEVGTTNCTYIEDYEKAINERTVALLRVHPSNFRLQGFTHRVELAEMEALAKKKEIMVIDDLGSGCFLDTESFGLEHEPTVQESVAARIDVVCFSGDKLVGGPQAGIILGKKQYIDLIKKHPLARTLRIDKTRLAGLATTLTHYLKGEALEKVPVWNMISLPINTINTRAQEWASVLPGIAIVTDGVSMIGGGSLPGGTIPTKLLEIKAKSSRKEQNRANLISQRLREHKPPVIVRIEKDTVFLDPRTVFPDEDEIVIEALRKITDTGSN
jgi:L-seryl-tRNA(Ser) seleniumtransferase